MGYSCVSKRPNCNPKLRFFIFEPTLLPILIINIKSMADKKSITRELLESDIWLFNIVVDLHIEIHTNANNDRNHSHSSKVKMFRKSHKLLSWMLCEAEALRQHLLWNREIEYTLHWKCIISLDFMITLMNIMKV